MRKESVLVKFKKRDTPRILMVDAEKEIQDLLSRCLKEEGYDGELVEDTKQALNKIKGGAYNVVVIQFQTVDKASLEVLKEIKHIRSDIVTVIISDHDSLEAAMEALESGAYDYLSKPLEATRVKITLKRGIEQQKLSLHNRMLVKNLEEKNLSLNETVQQLIHLNKNIQAIYIGITATLAEVLDAKDPQTRGHSERVAMYAEILAKEMELPENEIKAIKQASHLHDIGKIGVRDQILGKESRLDEEEWSQIQMHPKRGRDLLEPLTFLMNDVIPLVWYHHERYDGKGYPDGLKGEEIPLGARVILVADTLDAMTCDRPYRKAKTVDEAITEIIWGKGTQFDPKIVEVFLRAMEKGKFDRVIAIHDLTVAK